MYQDYTDLVEPFGIDESWLDVSGTLHLFGGDPTALADEIRRRMRQEFGLTISVGVSFNKVFAKLGSDYKKPDATTCITRENFRQIPVLALTATATPRVAEDIQQQLKFEIPHVLSKSFRRDNIAYVVRKANDKLGELLHILSSLKPAQSCMCEKSGSGRVGPFFESEGNRS